MKKLYLVVQDKYREEAMLKLRELGAVHVVKSGGTSEGLAKANERKARVENAIGLILPYKAPKKKPHHGRLHHAGKRRSSDLVGTEESEPYSTDAVNTPSRPCLIDLLLAMGNERKELEEEVASLGKERERIASWGDFDPAMFKDVVSKSCPMFLYELPVKSLPALPQDVKYIKLNEDKAFARIVVLDKAIPDIAPFALPEISLSGIDGEVGEIKSKMEALDSKIQGFADRHPVLQGQIQDAEVSIDFEEVLAGLKELKEESGPLGCSCLKGFAPAEDIGRIKAAVAENGWALMVSDPAPEDSPPTLLRNNPVARIIKPLFSFLGTTPGYREYDISPSYLLFFSLFFAMIFGDAAYGLLIMAAALMIGFSVKNKTGTMPDVAKFLLLLSATTVAWGAINGAWFAIPHKNLPFFLQALILPPFSHSAAFVGFPPAMQAIFNLPEAIPREAVKTWSIQFLCFSIGVVQLTWARTKRIMRELPSLTALSEAGWFLTLLGLYFLVLNMLLGIDFPPFAPYLIGTGAGLVIVFSKQRGGNFFVNIGKGLGGTFQMFLKIVGCFADIISYIRLFAVGIAGSMIAEIFNGMAVPEAGFGSFGLGFIVSLVSAVLILALGHALNIALTALSVIAHGVRLNLLEYAGNHLEMEWSGYEYKPFASKQKK
jgi:V/A-type H+-transporting ATPase subunit I